MHTYPEYQRTSFLIDLDTWFGFKTLVYQKHTTCNDRIVQLITNYVNQQKKTTCSNVCSKAKAKESKHMGK